MAKFGRRCPNAENRWKIDSELKGQYHLIANILPVFRTFQKSHKKSAETLAGTTLLFWFWVSRM